MKKYARLFLLAVVFGAIGAGVLYLIVNVILGLEDVAASITIGAALGIYLELTDKIPSRSKSA